MVGIPLFPEEGGPGGQDTCLAPGSSSSGLPTCPPTPARVTLAGCHPLPSGQRMDQAAAWPVGIWPWASFCHVLVADPLMYYDLTLEWGYSRYSPSGKMVGMKSRSDQHSSAGLLSLFSDPFHAAKSEARLWALPGDKMSCQRAGVWVSPANLSYPALPSWKWLEFLQLRLIPAGSAGSTSATWWPRARMQSGVPRLNRGTPRPDLLTWLQSGGAQTI